MDWTKRLKSFGIVFGSMVLTAFIAVVPTVDFANLVGWLHDVVIGFGVPGAVWAFFTALVAQIWFVWRNSVKVNRAAQGVGSSRPDLY